MISENLINAINIASLIAIFSSVTWSVYKKKYDVAILLGVIAVLFVTFKYILKIF